MSVAVETLPAFPFDWDGTRLPAEVEALRAEPVRRVRTIAGAEAWLVSSYELCRQVLEDPRFSLKDTSAPGAPRQYALTIPPHVVNNMGNITGAGLRKAVMKAINPKAPGLEEWLRARAGALVDALVAEGAPGELRGAYADPYSSGLHCRMLGIPEEDGPRLLRSLDVAFMNAPSEIEAARLHWDRDIAYMTERLDDPATGGLMAELAALREDPEYAHLTDEMLATVGVTLFGAGVISTAGFLTMALVSVLTRPDVRAALTAGGGHGVAGAMDELLRVNLSIGDGLPRLALEDVRLGDVEVRAGELVLVLVEAANHDPLHFPDPLAFRPDRENAADHLSFGGGRHYCPATALGKRHAEIALETLLDRLPELRLAVPVEQLVWRTNFMKRLPERLPVAW
ncbi:MULTISPECIES: cytochrome P450 [Streptomyces]|uniref:Putative cytochrome P450 hydroxylase n=1 Tax=Streptomyces venezuelae (strain ATCC 10712 / CBS 650.69 / DSM 40230 / JCM 4526 / NBRC 13096 / PD 04745) TaxID=953739 RepID=F2RJE2_STRVP|nr:cytochrome P450 [Streptomyces venezuelae]APE21169.1 cytochrome [Streptomyces venezuelae]QER98561.1 cytochrome P450 [Streptomyces venezuelae ATCC 10712]CCA55152.1 putative cytochrome P450 hydroxylase [Streptomyces venezuelae ATCC 10712]